MPVARRVSDQFKQVRENIESAHNYFKKNIQRYHDFKKFVFETSITADDLTKLDILGKPPLEFNKLEAMISRLKGEFSKHKPDIIARASDGVRIEELTPQFLQTIDVVKDHINEIFYTATNDSFENKMYSDILGGGFSAAHVYTDYINEMSFEQNIHVEKVFDPTLTFFDPLARLSHKGDGAYAGFLIPKSREDFVEEFGNNAVKDMTFLRSTSVGSFNWSYNVQDVDIVLIAEYFFKNRKKEKIVKLSNGHVVLEKHYDQFLEFWKNQDFIEQAPIVIESRNTTIETIERYTLCENEILAHDKTVFKYLPVVFFDGNSEIIRDNENAAAVQMTRPYVYQAKGIQQLCNFSGQTVATEIENMVMHKFMVALESIPEGYGEAYKNVQQASTLIYNAFYKDDATVPLPPPREIQRTPTPPIVESTFMGSDRVTQTILGTYDSVLGVNDKQISGVAIQQGALQSNAAALPYLHGYINGMNRVSQIILDLIPKFYVTPRSLPIRKPDGKRSFQIIHNSVGGVESPSQNSVDIYYNPNSIQIKVEAGVSSGIQKQVALDQIIKMMQSSEIFAEFINTMGLEIIIDNLDIRNIEVLKAKALEFMKMQQEKAQQAQQQGDPQLELAQAQMETVREVELAKVEQLAIKAEGDQAIQTAKVAIEKQNSDIKYQEVMAKVMQMEKQLEMQGIKMGMEQEKIDSENARTAVESALNFSKHLHDKTIAERETENAEI